jgi:poly-gamma-glutamate capsule biosynthesis protein CapA/YwtB (metallophosphatase superfamily)
LVLACALPAPAGAASALPKPAVSINWVGDIALSRAQGLPPHGGRGLFTTVKRFLRRADVTTGNLEGTLGRGGTTKCKGNCFAFQAPPGYARLLARVGFDLMNLANNHSLDAGPGGLRQTRQALRRAHVSYTGIKGQLNIARVNGLRLGFLGFAPYPWASPLTDIPAAKRIVRRAARKSDIVIVFIHAGAEGAGALHTPHGTEHAFGENRGAPRRFAHAAIRNGADAVLGSGPHVLRGMECYRRRVIAYSLGNFAGYRTLSTAGVTALSGILRVQIASGGRFVGGELFPVRIARPGMPRHDPSRASIKLVRRLSRQDFGARACRVGAQGRITPPR